MCSMTPRSQTPAASSTSSDPCIWTEHCTGLEVGRCYSTKSRLGGLDWVPIYRVWVTRTASEGYEITNGYLASKHYPRPTRFQPGHMKKTKSGFLPSGNAGLWAKPAPHSQPPAPFLPTTATFSFSLHVTVSRKPFLTASSSPTSWIRSPVKYSCSPSISPSY